MRFCGAVERAKNDDERVMTRWFPGACRAHVSRDFQFEFQLR